MTTRATLKAIGWLTMGAAVLALFSGEASAAKPSAPTAKTEPATAISETVATLNASINPESQASTYYFQIGPSAAFGTDTMQMSAGAGASANRVSTLVSQLTPATTYYYRVVASNVSGQTIGAMKTFQTSKPAAPTVKTEAATAISYSGASLNANVDAHGQLSTYYFEYGTSAALGSNTSLESAGSGTASVHVEAPLSGLTANTTYYYRVVASSSGGQINGSTKTLRTPAIPLSLTITGVPNPVPYGGEVQIEGTLAGSEAANHEVILQANPYPYTGGFQQVGNPIVTSATGGFSFLDPGLRTSTQFRVQTVGTSVVTSSLLQEEVSVLASLHAKRTRKPGYVRLYGTVTPGQPGALVAFQLVKGQKGVNQAAATLRSNGRSFSRIVHIRQSGVYRVEVAAHGGNTTGYSTTILIRKAQGSRHHHKSRR